MQYVDIRMNQENIGTIAEYLRQAIGSKSYAHIRIKDYQVGQPIPEYSTDVRLLTYDHDIEVEQFRVANDAVTNSITISWTDTNGSICSIRTFLDDDSKQARIVFDWRMIYIEHYSLSGHFLKWIIMLDSADD